MSSTLDHSTFDHSTRASAVAPVLGPLGCAVADLGTALAEPDLAAGLELLDDLRAGVERLTVALAAQAQQRGTPQAAGFSSTTDWVSAHSRSLSVGDAHQVSRVALAVGECRHAPLAAAFTAGQLPVRHAARLLRTLEQIAPFVDTDTYLADQDILIPLAVSGSDKDLLATTRHLVALVVPQADTLALEQQQRQARAVRFRTSPGGMTDLVCRLDPEGAAFLLAGIDPLAAPCPDEDGPDPRTPAQRRYDALLMVVQRGMTSPGAAPTTAKAKVVVTLSYDQLVGDLRGLGRTMTGQQLSPGTIRRLTCEADLVPMVLGGPSEVLDLGRTVRLATPAQRLVAWHEQRRCTHQGCTIPAQWCDLHHGRWWSRDGLTDKDNLYLLCPFHHTRVHDLDLSPRTGPLGNIRWEP